jgi:hypothetical protein
MTQNGLEGPLVLLARGAIGFGEFARVTRGDWLKLAAHLMMKWTPPAGVTREDVSQELLLAAWLFVGQWDESRGVSLPRFVVWNAIDKAKKWLHKQRGAKRQRDNDEGRFHRSVSSYCSESGQNWTITRLSVQYAPEVGIDLERTVSALLEGSGGIRKAAALRAYLEASGDVIEAARRLYGDPAQRLLCRFGNDQAAVIAVRAAERALLDAIAA